MRRADEETGKAARRWYVRAALSVSGRYAVQRLRRAVGRGITWLKSWNGGRHGLGGLAYDARVTIRSLRRTPRFTLIAVFALALGIGINAGVFAHVDALSFRPLAAGDPERLVALYGERVPGPGDPGAATDDWTRGQRLLRFSYPDWLDYRQAMDDALEGLAGFVSLRASLSDGEGAVQVWTELVTSNWFQVVRPEMEIGRPLQPGDEDAVVLSHAFWTRHFGGSRSVLGRTVVINGQPFTVVGVTDPLFSGTRLGAFAPEVWMPLRTIERVRPDLPRFLESRERQWLIMVGRLAEGVSKERAEASANIVATALGEAFPASHAERRVRVVSNERPENEAAHGISPRRLRFGGLVAMAAGMLVLLVACANVASLQLARGLERRGEVAVRMSLGASRGRVIGQAMVESVVLALGAGLVGIGVARLIVWAGIGGALEPPTEFRSAVDVAIDWRVVAFTSMVSILAGVVAAALPAWRESRADPVVSMKSAAGGSARSPRVLDGLVVAQVGFSFVVLVGAALFIRSLDRQQAVDPGFARENGLMMTLDPSLGGTSSEEVRAFYRRLVDELAAVPGVRDVARATSFPLSGTYPPMVGVSSEDRDPSEEGVRSVWYAVQPGWFEALGTPAVEGRTFTPGDSAGRPPVVMVNQTLSETLFPGEGALGRRVRVGGSPVAEVVGIVPDIKLVGLTDEPQPFVARSLPQTSAGERSTILVRTDRPPASLVRDVRRTTSAVDPTVAIIGPETLEEGTAIAFWLPETSATVASVLGLLALLLSIAGIYGLVSHGVERRMREIGIRMALGGHANLVAGLVLRRGLALVTIGMSIGLAGALALSGVMGRVLWGVSPTDPLTYAAMVVVVLAVGALASWIPARRVAGVDPARVLRAE